MGGPDFSRLYLPHVRGARLHRTWSDSDRTLCGIARPWMTDNERETFGPGMTDCPRCAAKVRRIREHAERLANHA